MPVYTDCITIQPAEFTVDGITDQSAVITATFTRPGLVEQGITIADLEKLVVSVNGACLNYMTINHSGITYAINGMQITATIPITINGDAPSTVCQLRVTDPQGIASPPLDCGALFTIISTAGPTEPCTIESIEPVSLRIGLGVIPRIRTIIITANEDLEAAGITPEDLSFAEMNGTRILDAQIAGDRIIARVLFWRTQPGTYNVTLGSCGTIPFTVQRF
jgi:hypothetical protein